jgi:conjugal transfer mating pair stabilization protein TraN
MLVNDGSTDAAGNCTALTYLFSGRPMDCKKAGVSTAFKNCCKESDTVYNDSLGTRAELELASAAVTGTFTAMSAAYTTYNAAIAGGATTAVAADTAATAATDAFIGAFDPTTLAISVAIALITEYLLSGCEQTDMETAALRSSGYCVEVGEYCSQRWWYGCVQKAKAHCCFNSKLARIVHEQGRPQLQEFAALAPNYFGQPEAPSCDGFTPLQFQSLDFSTIDLSEYYDDIATDTIPDIQNRIEEGFNDYLDATGSGS